MKTTVQKPKKTRIYMFDYWMVWQSDAAVSDYHADINFWHTDSTKVAIHFINQRIKLYN